MEHIYTYIYSYWRLILREMICIFSVAGTMASEQSELSAHLRDSRSWSNCHLENACRLYAQISRDDDTARRYTSRRRVANFPRRGFSIIPLARRPAPRWETVVDGGGCVGGGGGCEDGDDGGERVLFRSLFRSFSLARKAGMPWQRVGPFGSQWSLW